MRAKLSVTESELAKGQSKNKLLSQCLENGKKFKYDAPVSSQNDVNKLLPRFRSSMSKMNFQ